MQSKSSPRERLQSQKMLKIYNTLSGKKEVFKTVLLGEVRMYVCGPTVYDLSHIGHARSAVAFDVIYRYLRYRGYKVTYARNYTDIDDKIIERAKKEGVSAQKIAERYTKAFDEDMERLGIELPTFRPKATEIIKEIVELVQALIGKDYAYVVEGEGGNNDVYFSVRKFKDYGKLSGKNIEELETGARVEVDERKKDPLDFALWKASKPGEPFWDSPWGKGRPGWHIECSAMNLKYLGETFDIHGGGKDLIFPHHENEIAQSETLTEKQFVRYWLHNGFVNIDREKMSKSLGNILTIRDALKNYPAEAIRLFLLSSHYRSPIDYSTESLKNAESELDRFYTTLERMEKDWAEVGRATVPEDVKSMVLQPFLNAMNDDFNTAVVIGFIFQRVTEVNRLMDYAAKTGIDDEFQRTLPKAMFIFKEMGGILGVFNKTPEEYLQEKKRRVQIPPQEIERLIAERDRARKEKDFKKADAVRKVLEDKGIILEDASYGTRWKRKV